MIHFEENGTDGDPTRTIIYDRIHILPYMVKPVSLSDPAFAVLRREKRENESDSDVILRLAREAREGRRDPLSFLSYRPRRAGSYKAFEAWARGMDAADR